MRSCYHQDVRRLQAADLTALATGTPVTGGMAERTIAAVLKTAVRATVPWVRIPLPPPLTIL